MAQNDPRQAAVKSIKSPYASPTSFGAKGVSKGGPRTAVQDNRGFNTGKASEPDKGK